MQILIKIDASEEKFERIEDSMKATKDISLQTQHKSHKPL